MCEIYASIYDINRDIDEGVAHLDPYTVVGRLYATGAFTGARDNVREYANLAGPRLIGQLYRVKHLFTNDDGHEFSVQKLGLALVRSYTYATDNHGSMCFFCRFINSTPYKAAKKQIVWARAAHAAQIASL